jgi:hypothetical protein
MRGCKPGVLENKTKQMENEMEMAGDVDRRTPPEQGEGPTSVGVVTE